MSPKPRRTIRHGRGAIRPLPNGRWRADLSHNGQRYRQRCETIEEARQYIDDLQDEIRNPSPLTAAQIADARNALRLLPPDVTLTQAAERYRQQHVTLEPLTCLEAYHRHLRDKERAHQREASIAGLRNYVGRFAAAHAQRQMHTISTQDILDWLDSLKIGAASRANHRRYLRGFFRWAVDAKHASNNPVTAITVPSVDDPSHGVLTPAQLRHILDAALLHAADIAGYITLGAWCGVRTSELQRLNWDALDSARTRLHIGPGVAKLGQQRYIPLPPCAAAWLQRCGPLRGPV